MDQNEKDEEEERCHDQEKPEYPYFWTAEDILGFHVAVVKQKEWRKLRVSQEVHLYSVDSLYRPM